MQNKNGFTIVDLIVSLALVSIALAILLPVIQRSRESARSRFCTIRLRQIGVGAMDYEVTFGRLPTQLGSRGAAEYSGWTNPSSDEYYLHKQSASPLALIAWAQNDLNIAAKFVDYDVPSLGEPFIDLEGWADLAAERRPEFRCPSNQLDGLDAERFTLVIQPLSLGGAGNNDQIGFVQSDVGADYGYTNFVGCLGASSGGWQRAEGDNTNRDSFWHFRGMITSRENMQSCFVTDGDGLSNTIMFGENIGSVDSANGIEIAYRQSWLSGGVARGRGIAPWMTGGDPDNPLLGNETKSVVYGFGSTHPFGVGFLMGDGSTRRLARRVDWETYYQLCGAFDSLD